MAWSHQAVGNEEGSWCLGVVSPHLEAPNHPSGDTAWKVGIGDSKAIAHHMQVMTENTFFSIKFIVI